MEKKYLIDSTENIDFLKKQTDGLVEFGRKFPSEGGSSYYLSKDGTPFKDRDRELWITCRMTHVYSIASMLSYDGAGKLAEKGLMGICTELKDKVNGGYYAGVSRDGTPIETKQCYAHAFVLLAATSAKLAGIDGADELLRDAISVYDKYFWVEEEGLSVDTWDTEFKNCSDYRGLNANMHTVEAFLAVADATGNEEYRNRAGRIIERVTGWAEANDYRIPEHFTSDWEVNLDMNIETPDDPFKPYGATPGHGIEWARLITQWATSVYGEHSEKAWPYITTAEKLFNRAIIDGWNVDGSRGIVYTTDWNGKPVVHDRMHWTLAEAINTSAVLYRVTNDEKYSNLYAEFMKYLDECVIDHVLGSWLHQLDYKNEIKETVWPGKSDLYHAFQATLIPYNKINLSIAKAIQEEILS